MSMTAGKLVEEAHALAPHARAFVAERLIESLDASPGDKLSTAWREEIRNRCREMDESEVKHREADSVFAKAYATLE